MLGPFIFSKISEVMKPKEKKPTSFEIEKKPTEEENQPKQLKNQPNFYSDPNIHSHLNPKEKFNGKSNGNSENFYITFPMRKTILKNMIINKIPNIYKDL
ncbi:hypothetical protein M0811_10792 [Anaeramoeba ignava]|uniref:Uncharacterized protein n=1 Tax=Anaeramoeba ignava TaxID=1746090 RepID=A0A9Q0LFF8_ANAIG|nr:hypothetical protein M0811_10792 [Anaeramoeba ignava]